MNTSCFTRLAAPFLPTAFRLLAAAACALVTLGARAELLVLNQGGGGSGANGLPAIFRFDPATGARLGMFGHDSEAAYAMTLASPDEICVNSNTLGYHDLFVFDLAGEFHGSVASAPAAFFSGMVRGANGGLYTLMQVSDDSFGPGPWQIVRFDRDSATVVVPSGTGGMTAPVAMLLGADGLLYVADTAAGVLRFDAATGAFVDVFIPTGTGGLSNPTRMAFGPDGRLYISSGAANAVYRFEATGAFVDVFVAAADGHLSNPAGLAFGPDGDLYVVSRGAREVLRYNGHNGRFRAVAVADAELRSPVDLVFTPETETRRHPASGSARNPAHQRRDRGIP